jgi:hypothetical protein
LVDDKFERNLRNSVALDNLGQFEELEKNNMFEKNME